LDIGGQHGRRFCATLAGLGGHTPFVQAGAETPYTGAEAVKPGGWVPLSGMKMRRCVARSAFYWWSAHCAARMLLSDELMRCCAAGTNGCLDLRRRAFALNGQVSAEWSRCPGSMARRATDNVAPLRRSSAGWMPARIGRLFADVGRRHPVTIRRASLMAGLMRRVWALRHQTGAQYSAVEWNFWRCF